jgi:hypothetical protein
MRHENAGAVSQPRTLRRKVIVNYADVTDLGDLDDVALQILQSRHGSFLKAFADAWLKADPYNKGILKTAWLTLIEKYDLHTSEMECYA